MLPLARCDALTTRSPERDAAGGDISHRGGRELGGHLFAEFRFFPESARDLDRPRVVSSGCYQRLLGGWLGNLIVDEIRLF